MVGLALLSLQIAGAACQTEIVVACEYQNIVWAAVALRAEGGFLVFLSVSVGLHGYYYH